MKTHKNIDNITYYYYRIPHLVNKMRELKKEKKSR